MHVDTKACTCFNRFSFNTLSLSIYVILLSTSTQQAFTHLNQYPLQLACQCLAVLIALCQLVIQVLVYQHHYKRCPDADHVTDGYSRSSILFSPSALKRCSSPATSPYLSSVSFNLFVI